MDLARALRISPVPRLALVGAGGKTRALFHLARQLPPPVIVSATTHLARQQTALADRHFEGRTPQEVFQAAEKLAGGVNLFTGPLGLDERTQGVGGETLEALHTIADTLKLPFLLEADGSRQRPLKAPAAHEPAIPPWVDQVVGVAGLSGLGLPLSDLSVHRPEVFAQLSGLKPGERITPTSLAQVLVHPQGGLKNIPESAARRVLLTQADSPTARQTAEDLADTLLAAYWGVLVGSLSSLPSGEDEISAVYEPVGGVLLAAGASSRLGQPKQLLPWQGRPLVRYVAEAGLAGGLSPLIVVVGAEADRVREALRGLPIIFVENPSWPEGQGSSVRVGVGALPQEVGAAVFLLSDQPYIDSSLIQNLRSAHSHSMNPLIAPLVGGRRANPVLFDRVTFADLLRVEGDTGGRSLFTLYPLEFVPWEDERLLLDIDTPEDFARITG